VESSSARAAPFPPTVETAPQPPPRHAAELAGWRAARLVGIDRRTGRRAASTVLRPGRHPGKRTVDGPESRL